MHELCRPISDMRGRVCWEGQSLTSYNGESTTRTSKLGSNYMQWEFVMTAELSYTIKIKMKALIQDSRAFTAFQLHQANAKHKLYHKEIQ